MKEAPDSAQSAHSLPRDILQAPGVPSATRRAFCQAGGVREGVLSSCYLRPSPILPQLFWSLIPHPIDFGLHKYKVPDAPTESLLHRPLFHLTLPGVRIQNFCSPADPYQEPRHTISPSRRSLQALKEASQ